MYSTCIFCHASLGTNEALEAFPVGRRLAFDPERGRLWVVCARCARWNLSPLETRWEAVEECERRWRETPLRMATDRIGLARLGEGTELVRVGRAPRAELAAWRYGERFAGRRRRALAGSLGAFGAAGVLMAVGTGGFAVGLVAGGALGTGLAAYFGQRPWWARLARIPLGDGRAVDVATRHLVGVRLVELPAAETGGEAWGLTILHEGGAETLRGPVAEQALGLLMPQVNRAGASAARVREAVRLIERAGSAERIVPEAMRLAAARGARFDAVAQLPADLRLALEMAAHEESERHALAGELALLEAAWREAEAVAAVADDLLLPPAVEALYRRLKRTVAGDDRPAL